MFYKIGEVSSMLKVSKNLIYGWEKQGLVKPYKSPSGHRRFDDNHLDEMMKLLGIKK